MTDLEDGLSKRITQQEEDLKTRSRFQFDFAQGLAMAAARSFTAARSSFLRALEMYKFGKPRELFTQIQGALTLQNLFIAILNKDKDNFQENAKKELADNFYDDLEAELTLAAERDTDLAPLVKGRKSRPSPPVAEPKTPEAAPAKSLPAAPPSDAK